MSKYHDDSTYATHPGNVALDRGKLKGFRRRLPFLQRLIAPSFVPTERVVEHLADGLAGAAVVVQLRPLLVLAYTEDLDWGVLLSFTDAEARGLVVGSQLLTVNTYLAGTLAEDLAHGPRSTHAWSDCYPLIADFLCNDMRQVHERKREVEQWQWRRAAQIGGLLLGAGAKPRDGNPYRSMTAVARTWDRGLALDLEP